MTAPSLTRPVPSLTTQCVLALLAGLLVAQIWPEAALPDSATGSAMRTLVRGWGNMFRVLSIPLTVALVLGAVLSADVGAQRLGRVSLRIPPVFVLLMGGGFVLSYLVVPRVMGLFPGLAFSPDGDEVAKTSTGAAAYTWIDDVIPPNLFGAIVNDNILGVVVITIVLAFALRQTSAPLATIASGAQIAVDAMFVVAGWLLRLSPLIIFAAVVPLAVDGATKLGGVLLAYVAIEVALLLVISAGLLGVAALAYGGSPRVLLRAVSGALIAALTTRSSLATIPMIIRAAEHDLGVSPDIAGYVTSLSGALLKVSRSVSSPVRLLVLTSVLAIPLTWQQYVLFSGTILLMSMSTSGVPKAVSGHRSLSAYVAVGVPAAPVTLLSSLTWATDPLMTLSNTVAYLTATLVVARIMPRPRTAPLPVSPSGLGVTV